MHGHSMVYKDSDSEMGVVVSRNNVHNIRIVGQLRRAEKYEISGFQQLRAHASEEAEHIQALVQCQREDELQRALA
jgi:hypothetical protein